MCRDADGPDAPERFPQDRAIIQPLVLSLLHWCRKVVSSLPEPGVSRGDFLYQSICNWVQENYAEPLSRDSVASLFNISANHLSRLFSQQGTMSFVDYVRWVRMAKARTILQKYHLPVGKWRSAAAMPIATILAVCSGASLA